MNNVVKAFTEQLLIFKVEIVNNVFKTVYLVKVKVFVKIVLQIIIY